MVSPTIATGSGSGGATPISSRRLYPSAQSMDSGVDGRSKSHPVPGPESATGTQTVRDREGGVGPWVVGGVGVRCRRRLGFYWVEFPPSDGEVRCARVPGPEGWQPHGLRVGRDSTEFSRASCPSRWPPSPPVSRRTDLTGVCPRGTRRPWARKGHLAGNHGVTPTGAPSCTPG